MVDFYIFTIIIAFLFIINKRIATLLLFIGCVYFLYHLVEIRHFGDDYYGYLDAYEGALRLNGYPWARTITKIDAEELYLWYTAMVRIFSGGLPMSFFLSFNFLLCLLISFFMLKGFKKDYQLFFWAMALPVVFPTVFYYLIRSSLSFFLVALGFFSLLQDNKLKAFVFGFGFTYLGINLHSQYILLGFLMIVMFFLLKLKHKDDYKYNINMIMICSVGLIGVLLILKQFTEQLGELLSFLPSSNIVAGKLGYLASDDDRGIRVTSILSIVIYPVMMYNVIQKTYFTETTYIFKSKLKERKFLILFFALICFGASINIAYFDLSHVAGRLSRISDYLGMCILLPLFFKISLGNKLEYVALLLITILAPILYSAVYFRVNWNVF